MSKGHSRYARQTKAVEKDFGRWEKHTTGFGSKMLAKMGWKSGTGLGSKGEGIVNPVKATKHTEFGKGLSHMQVSKVYMYIRYSPHRDYPAHFIMQLHVGVHV